MSHWNHRVVREVIEHPNLELSEVVYQITEVYYNDEGAPSAWCQRSHSPYGNDLNDLRGELERMLRALDKPVLEVVDGKLVEYNGKDL